MDTGERGVPRPHTGQMIHIYYWSASSSNHRVKQVPHCGAYAKLIPKLSSNINEIHTNFTSTATELTANHQSHSRKLKPNTAHFRTAGLYIDANNKKNIHNIAQKV